MLDLTINTEDKSVAEEVKSAFEQTIKEWSDLSGFIKTLKKKIGNFEVGLSGMNILIKDRDSNKVVAKILI